MIFIFFFIDLITSYKSFQLISSKYWNSDNQQFIYCKDGEYRVNCDICDYLCIVRFHKNYLKSRTHVNKFRKRQQLNKSFQTISQI